ncbi:MAG TPA: NAD-dependent deacylase [Cytophagales bacterium]|nr:NAD-dependent deacylase [Cytophagales bacterium]
MRKLVVLSGAGISQESGISTFRDSNGLWENHKIEDVASPAGWERDKELVLNFYNQRRKQLLNCKPNRAHTILTELEKKFDVHIITQNVDDLHERAGSSKVLHLHGELMKSRSTVDPRLVYTMKNWEIKLGDKCEKGSQLRPHIVWFGEMVPNISKANDLAAKADIFLIIGTSLLVYPANQLIDYVPEGVPVYVIDPHIPDIQRKGIHFINEKASTGMEKFAQLIESKY